MVVANTQVDLEALKSRHSLADVVEAAGVQLRGRGRVRQGVCPFHQESEGSFTVYADTSRFYCFGCGVGGDVLDFIQRAEGLCRLFTGREATIVLVDHDRVEPHNLLRQNFYPEDVGHFKSQALADRLARAYGRPIGYLVYAFREDDSGSYGHRYAGLPRYGNCLLIGCTDNAAARRAMAECLRDGRQQWLIDAGNDANWGQVLVGNVADPSYRYDSAFDGETCYLLPAPTLQRPDLLTTVPTTPPDVDCAAALDLTNQDPTINQMIASIVLMVVRRLVTGTRPFMGLYLDMELGTVTPTYVTPEAVKRVMKASRRGRRRTV